MQIHFYITSSDLERYQKEGSCYVQCRKQYDLLHISIGLNNHTIEKLENSEEYILRKIN